MRYLVLSDIHANRAAFESVLADARRRSWDRCLVLGDLVGYGADPNAVLDLLHGLGPDEIIRGNHDKVVAGVASGEQFNPLALASARWTQRVLRPEHRRWLADLPEGPRAVDGEPEILLAHGSPLDEEAYILGHEDALVAFELGAFECCLFGHTHYPMVIGLVDDRLDVQAPTNGEGGAVELEPGRRYLVNPGSIGQPRDGDPRACYGILDTERRRMEYHRVVYAVESSMARIIEEGLPAPLAARLPRGI